MIDTHCHIDTERFFDDWREVLDRAEAAGVEAFIVPAIEPGTFDRLFEVVGQDKRLYCGIGVHPHNAKEVDESVLERINNLSKHPKVVAIGEIGLDYFYDFAPKDVQIDAFRKQIEIAKKQNLPIIVHNRDSDEDLLNVLEKEQNGDLKGVLHCFSGDVNMMKKSIDLGFHVSFTGNITFKKTDLTDVVKETPMERILLETDSPWMAPIPHRGKRNEPMNVRYVAEKISEIKTIPINEVIKMTTDNAKKLFKLFVFFVLFTFAAGIAVSQGTTTIYDDDYEKYAEEEDIYDLYPKTFGIGPVFGTNTIVETYNNGQDISYEGILAVGGLLNYRLLKYLTLSASYTYSKNSKLSEKFAVDPNTHQSIELSSFWSPNPNGRVNFYGIAGFSYLMNKYGRRLYNVDNPLGRKLFEYDNQFGMNTGVGFNINVDLGYAGIMAVMAEWRLNFVLAKTKLNFDPRYDPAKEPDRHNKKTEISTFYSIPRLAIVWYPKFK